MHGDHRHARFAGVARVIGSVEHRNLGDRCDGLFDMDDLFASISAGAKRSDRAFDDDVEARSFVAPEEEDLISCEMFFDGTAR